jgi:hypothetical protein
MSAIVARLPAKSNQGGTPPFHERNGRGQTILAINAALRKKFGKKTWASLAFLIGVEDRTARHRLAGTRPYDFDDLVALLRSDVGLDVLRALMGDPKRWPAWFKICIRKIREAKLLTDMQQMKLLLEETTNQTAADVAKLAEDA